LSGCLTFAAAMDLFTMTIPNRIALLLLWLGFDSLAHDLPYTALAAGPLATAFSLLRSVPLPGLLMAEAWAGRLHRRDTGIAYGIALAAGALLVYPFTFWLACLSG
jgi:prepilin peptidase CpaA